MRGESGAKGKEGGKEFIYQAQTEVGMIRQMAALTGPKVF
jgi:hypothetical protein